jgi:glycosyltransferase involved in cell wall biosynthesis
MRNAAHGRLTLVEHVTVSLIAVIDTPDETSTAVNDQRPAITIAIPYYADLGYLRQAIDSVLAQTRSDWELIVVDDAGPEPADELVRHIGDPRITFHRNAANLGLAGNWNECIRLANAPWVTLLHADDALASGYVASVLAATSRNPALAAIFTDAEVIGADGQSARSLPEFVKRFARRPADDHDVSGDRGLASVLANNYIMCPTLCYRTDLAATVPFDGRWRMVMDLDHTAQLLLDGHILHGIRRPLYRYRRHSANQTTSLTASSVRFEEEIALYRELAERAESAGWGATARTARRRIAVRSHLVIHAVIDLGHRRIGASRRKLALLRSDLRPAPAVRAQR